MPSSFIASRASSSASSLPQLSMAASSVASVYSGLGMVFFFARLRPDTGTVSDSSNRAVPLFSVSSSFSLSSERLNTALQPGLTTETEWERNVSPSTVVSMTSVSFSHLGENASSIRPAIIR